MPEKSVERAPAPGGKRPRNRRGEGARLRIELIEAAARLLESSGDARLLTLAAVAREVGVAAPSIYRHFSDVGQLVEAVVADRFQRLDDALVHAMKRGTDPASTLAACCEAYCKFGLEHPGHYQILFGAHLELDPDRPSDRPGERVFGRLVEAVEAYAAAGVARSHDPHAMAVNVWVALHGIVSLRISRPQHAWPPLEDLIDAALSGQVGLHPTSHVGAGKRRRR
jgi:AcrR family transcriptional regulator